MNRRGWGAIPVMVVAAAAGLVLIAVADALSRTGRSGGSAILWTGLTAMVAPAAYFLASARISRAERVGIVLTAGLALYMAKVLHDPFGFTFADELVHQYNAIAILRNGRLFGYNFILPVTRLYPGLETVTAALSATSGLSTFASGLVVIGFARLMLTGAMFLLFETATGSSRTAGLAALAYAGAPSYLFFTAAYSYESLALPLTVVLFLAMAREQSSPDAGSARSWTALGVGLAVAIPVTHHLTSYAAVLLAIVLALVASHMLHRLRLRSWLIAATITGVTVGWLVFVASETVGYLSPLADALRATIKTVAGESAGRSIFPAPNRALATPWAQQLVTLGAVAIVVVALPFALREVWRRQRLRRNPVVLILALVSVLYPLSLGLRLVPRAWETGARASEFLFVGVALMLGLSGVQRWTRGRYRIAGQAAAASCAAILIAGGFIAGSTPGLRLSRAFRVEAEGHRIDPPEIAVGRWAEAALGSRNRFAAEESQARVLQIHGQVAFSGTNPPIAQILHSPSMEPWMLPDLARLHLRYVVVDRRALALRNIDDRTFGYFFGAPDLRPSSMVVGAKFEDVGDRIYDSGDIVIYDLERTERAPAE